VLFRSVGQRLIANPAMGLCYVLAIHHLWKGRWGVRQLYPVAHDVEDFLCRTVLDALAGG